MSFAKRSRIVSVRVTPAEYQTLDRISRRHGANSVSEFLRHIIMHSDPYVSAARGGTRDVVEDLDELKRTVDRVAQMVTGGLALQGSPVSPEQALPDWPVADTNPRLTPVSRRRRAVNQS